MITACANAPFTSAAHTARARPRTHSAATVPNVASETSTGVDAHRYTHTASRYFRAERKRTSTARATATRCASGTWQRAAGGAGE